MSAEIAECKRSRMAVRAVTRELAEGTMGAGRRLWNGVKRGELLQSRARRRAQESRRRSAHIGLAMSKP